MNSSEYINLKKVLYNSLILFIESGTDEEEEFKSNYEKIINIENFQNEKHDEVMEIFRLISKISNNYHRTSNFDKKILYILSNYFKDIKHILTNMEIFLIFKRNKRILLYLLQNKILTIEKMIVDYFLSDTSYCYFFYPEIKFHIDKSERKRREEGLLSIDPNIFETFEVKRQTGENDSYICSLIREDSIDEFVKYVTQIKFPRTIKPSFFETNSFLLKMEEKITLIEYSAFFGSIQIFQYLRMNGAEMTDKLWLYAVHSKSAELIHLLETYEVEIDKYENVLIESIKCHHNEIADYINNNYVHNEVDFSKNIFEAAFHYYNYLFFPEDLSERIYFRHACKYHHQIVLNFLLEKIKYKLKGKIIPIFIDFIEIYFYFMTFQIIEFFLMKFIDVKCFNNISIFKIFIMKNCYYWQEVKMSMMLFIIY